MPALRKKQRTRAHIIEALSINHVEYHFLKEGWSIIRHQPHDYGIDLQVHLFNKEGYVEPEFFFVQVKSTDSFKTNSDQTHTYLDINIEDINLWSAFLEPVLLILYDAQR